MSISSVRRNWAMSAPVARRMSSVMRSPVLDISASRSAPDRVSSTLRRRRSAGSYRRDDMAGRLQMGDGPADGLLRDVLIGRQFALAGRPAAERGEHDQPGVIDAVIAEPGVPGVLDQPGRGAEQSPGDPLLAGVIGGHAPLLSGSVRRYPGQRSEGVPWRDRILGLLSIRAEPLFGTCR